MEELDDETDPPTPLMGISGEIRLVDWWDSHSEGILSDNIPRLSLPKDNRVGGAILVGGNSLSSGTTGVELDMSMDEENEFFANKRWGPCPPAVPQIVEIAPPIGRNLLPVINGLEVWRPLPIPALLPKDGFLWTKVVAMWASSSNEKLLALLQPAIVFGFWTGFMKVIEIMIILMGSMFFNFIH